MLFNSLHFLVFFPIVAGGYFLLRPKWRWIWLLAASCWFYMTFIPIYILILLFTIVIDYTAGLLIESAAGAARKRFLALSLAANLGVLAVFKYYNFVNDNVAVLFRSLDWSWPVPALGVFLPIGLSFHTFQAMSYTIEVYRGRYPAERHFGIYALYVMFFPQLVAGPIERPQNLLPQFREAHAFDYARVTDGLKRMTWGMLKKVAIADRLAIFVNDIYATPRAHSGATLLVATVFFAFQIYCDFSGYSDIAIGAAEVMGFRLMENFRRPYFSQSISEFWTRWHMSLSTWFRDYLYIPLGGGRVSRAHRYLNVMIVFSVSGLWHGASWTFVVWGVLNGLYLLAGDALAPLRRRMVELLRIDRRPMLLRLIRIGMTFGLTCMAWVFFRAKTIDDALYIVGTMFRGMGDVISVLTVYGKLNLLILAGLIALLESVHLLQRRTRVRTLIASQPPLVRWAVYYAAVLCIILLGSFGGSKAFIYFQF